jgi:long-subunit acyl-CoA synthetase (AMP-forming)
MNHSLSQRIAHVLDLQPDSPAIEYEGQWLSWRAIGGMSGRIGSLTDRGGQVGILLRNRPAQVAAFLGVLAAGGCVVVINPSRGDDRTRADITALRLPMIVGEPDDVTKLVSVSEGTTVVSMSGVADEPQVSAGDGRAADGGRCGARGHRRNGRLLTPRFPQAGRIPVTENSCGAELFTACRLRRQGATHSSSSWSSSP